MVVVLEMLVVVELMVIELAVLVVLMVVDVCVIVMVVSVAVVEDRWLILRCCRFSPSTAASSTLCT